jgi:hypothetical protein
VAPRAAAEIQRISMAYSLLFMRETSPRSLFHPHRNVFSVEYRSYGKRASVALRRGQVCSSKMVYGSSSLPLLELHKQMAGPV